MGLFSFLGELSL